MFVNYLEAQGYARWAGLRLMTEFEYQRAVRGDEDWYYPWGAEWDDEAAPRNKRDPQPYPVGSFPKGANEAGVFDLISNIWEWTSSPYVAYPGWKLRTVEVGEGSSKRKVEGFVDWDPNLRVAVSGFYVSPELHNRCTTRRATDRFQSTDGLGFRCAASIEPGRDISQTVLNEDVPVELRPPGMQYAPELATAVDRWRADEGSAEVPNYALITGYDYVIFVPISEPGAGTTLRQLREKSLEESFVHLGFLSTTMPMVEPALPAGTYRIAFRGKGEDAPPVVPVVEAGEKGEVAAAAPLHEYPEGIDLAQDNLLFYDSSDAIAAHLSDFKVDYLRDRRGTATIREASREVTETDEEGKQTTVKEAVDEVFFELAIPVAARHKSWNLDFAVRFAKDSFDDSWRSR